MIKGGRAEVRQARAGRGKASETDKKFVKLWHFWQRACGACAASKERRVEPGSTRYLKRTPPPPHSPPKYVCEGHVIVYVIVYVRWDRNAPSTEAEQANEAAKQRKRGIVVVKLPILLSYSERQRDVVEEPLHYRARVPSHAFEAFGDLPRVRFVCTFLP